MKKIISLIICAVMLFAAVGCALEEDRALVPVDFVPDEAITASDRNIAVDLLQATAELEKGRNVLVSPLSVKIALAMASNGADGETLELLEDFLGGGSIADINDSLSTYMNFLQQDKNTKLRIANSIWYSDKNFTIDKEFAQASRDFYSATLKDCTFNQRTVNKINKWVKKNTDGMIDEIVDGFESDTVMLLVNALVFDAQWEEIYTDDKITEGDFTSYSGDVREVSYMSSVEWTYLSGESFSGFIKNYEGGSFGFAALLPDEGVDVYELCEQLDGDVLGDVLNDASDIQVYVQIPKFSSEFFVKLVDSGVLSSLGLEELTDSRADFSKMGNAAQQIDEIVHKAFISVDEQGTRAGAATAVNYRNGIGCENSVILNRPFVYMILDRTTNTPLFMGVTLAVEN